MDDKKMTPFERGLLILCKGYWEERGCTLIGARVVTSGSDSPDSRADAAEDRPA